MTEKAGGWVTSETDPIPRWKVGPRIWRVNNQWRIRLYRPWKVRKLIEVQSDHFLLSLYILGIGAGWWKNRVFGKEN